MTTILSSFTPFSIFNQSSSLYAPISNFCNVPSSKPHFQLESGFFLKKSQISRKSSINGADPLDDFVEVLRVPHHWLEPSNALLESEWLRVTLHKWLDDEYCPEPTNIDISRVAAESYYQSLLQKTTDLGEILLKMARELESISYQESFHGAFSSANAAVNLIAERIEQDSSTILAFSKFPCCSIVLYMYRKLNS